MCSRPSAAMCRPACRWCSAPRASSTRPACCSRRSPANSCPTIRSPRCPVRASRPTWRKGLPTAVVDRRAGRGAGGSAGAGLLDRTFPLLFDRRSGRRRDRRRAEERLRHRRRRRHRRGARRQRAGRHGDARLRRAAAHRPGFRRRARDGDGAFRPRRPAALPAPRRSRAISPTGWRSDAAKALQGRPLAEGVATAAIAARIARERGIDAPIISAVAAILAGAITINEAVSALMSRPLRTEAE